MEYISRQTLHDYCRACLVELKQRKYNIYGLNLEIRQWLQDDTLDNPLASDTYSNNICYLCHDKLEELLEFRNMCARSRNTVLAILEKGKQKINAPTAIAVSEEQDALEKNPDWLEFDFDVSNKIETTICNKREFDIEKVDTSNKIETTICEKKEFDIEKFEVIVEPLISNIIPSDTKTEPEPIQYFKQEEVSEDDHESGSDYELEENDFHESSDSDGHSEIITPKTKTTSVNKLKGDIIKTPKTPKSSSTKEKTQIHCDECGRRCLNQQTLENHKRTHLGLKPFQCPQCDRSYNKSNHLQEHINVAHAEEKLNIICEFEGCGKQYNSDRTYKAHFRQKHLPVVKIQPKHICEDCGKSYSKLGSLKLHQFTHKTKDQYPYHCPTCGKAFTKRYAFDAHQLRHAGIKNFECPHCGLKKTTKDELQIHMNYHTKEKQWYCPRCPMVCSNSGNLRRHEQLVHQGIRPFTCQFCEESFGKLDHLKRHEMRHTGEKPHVCAECGKGFIQKVALKTHMKTHNKYLAKHQAELNIIPDGIM